MPEKRRSRAFFLARHPLDILSSSLQVSLRLSPALSGSLRLSRSLHTLSSLSRSLSLSLPLSPTLSRSLPLSPTLSHVSRFLFAISITSSASAPPSAVPLHPVPEPVAAPVSGAWWVWPGKTSCAALCRGLGHHRSPHLRDEGSDDIHRFHHALLTLWKQACRASGLTRPLPAPAALPRRACETSKYRPARSG